MRVCVCVWCLVGWDWRIPMFSRFVNIVLGKTSLYTLYILL